MRMSNRSTVLVRMKSSSSFYVKTVLDYAETFELKYAVLHVDASIKDIVDNIMSSRYLN